MTSNGDYSKMSNFETSRHITKSYNVLIPYKWLIALVRFTLYS